MQASEITNYLIEVSEDVAPLKSVSAHLRIAIYDLIPEVRNTFDYSFFTDISCYNYIVDDPSTDANVRH